MLCGGFAVAAAGLVSPGWPGTGMALLRFEAPSHVGIAKACRRVLWLPARIVEARRVDAATAMVNRWSPIAVLLEANVRRYAGDGRGVLPPLDLAA